MNTQRNTHTHTATPDGGGSPGWAWVVIIPSPTQRDWWRYVTQAAKGEAELAHSHPPARHQGIQEVVPPSHGGCLHPSPALGDSRSLSAASALG